MPWEVYKNLDFEKKKIIGEQFIRALDSISANIAEGHGRFHYLDRIKFCYNARGSLEESINWTEIMIERNIGEKILLEEILKLLKGEEIKLNNYINSVYRVKEKK